MEFRDSGMEAEGDSKTTDIETAEIEGEEDVSEASSTESVKLQVLKTTATDPVPKSELSLKSAHAEVSARRVYPQCIRSLSIYFRKTSDT